MLETTLHPQVKTWLAARRAAQRLPPEDLPLAEARRLAIEEARAMRGPAALITSHDLEVPCSCGGLRARFYEAPGLERIAPALLWLHGGGWVLGGLETHDALCGHLAAACRARVIAIDYRLAPEHPFPAALEDSIAATGWVAERGHALGIDPARIAVGGDSAGGNLAAAVAIATRDHGGPALAAQVLVYPITDYDLERPSYREKAEGFGLTRRTMAWFWEAYLRGGADPRDPRVSPLRAKDLSRLAPAYVLLARHDVLHDEGELYAERLDRAGVETIVDRYDDMIHGFLARVSVFERAQEAVERIGAFLRDRARFGSPPFQESP